MITLIIYIVVHIIITQCSTVTYCIVLSCIGNYKAWYLVKKITVKDIMLFVGINPVSTNVNTLVNSLTLRWSLPNNLSMTYSAS